MVDGLPTLEQESTNKRMVSGRERTVLYERAVRELPPNIPVNIMLYPMEGDYDAPIAYWTLAYQTGGSFMSVSRDWP